MNDDPKHLECGCIDYGLSIARCKKHWDILQERLKEMRRPKNRRLSKE